MEAHRIFFILLSLCLFSTVAASGAVNSTAKRLVKNLVKDYGETSVRPLLDYRKATEVSVRMLLYELIEFNENQQQITLRSNMRMVWKDELLTWNPEEWDNLTHISLHSNSIWTPKFEVIENVGTEYFIINELDLNVDYTGTVNWYFPVITTTACKINIVYFPYDIQQCNVTFSAWTEDSSRVRVFALDSEDARQQVYERNGIWTLHEFTAINESIKAKCCIHPFEQVVYSISLARETAFFTTQIVLPGMFLFLLVAVSFWLHPDTGEKIGFTVTNLLSLIVFQQLIAQFLPPTGEPRSIAVTVFFVMIAMSAIGVVLTVAVLRVYHRDPYTSPPKWSFTCLRIFIDKRTEQKMSTFYKFQQLKETNRQNIANGDKPPSTVYNMTEDAMEAKMRRMIEDEEISNTFMWKHLALGLDRAFGVILSVSMLLCVFYALGAFDAREQ